MVDDWLKTATGRLLAILEADTAHRKALAASTPDEPFRLVPVALDLSAIPPRWVDRMQCAAKDGVGESLRASIREEGWAAYAQGGLDAMHALCGAIVNSGGGAHYGARLDHAWDGIGGRVGTWFA